MQAFALVNAFEKILDVKQCIVHYLDLLKSLTPRLPQW